MVQQQAAVGGRRVLHMTMRMIKLHPTLVACRPSASWRQLMSATRSVKHIHKQFAVIDVISAAQTQTRCNMPCTQVVKAFPDYPKIRKDVLEKARAGLKP
jgi:hypothetical protein